MIAGIAFARRVFRLLDPESKFSQLLPDGADVKYGDIAFEIVANTKSAFAGRATCAQYDAAAEWYSNHLFPICNRSRRPAGDHIGYP